MNNRINLKKCIVMMVFLVPVLTGGAWAYSGGSGTLEDPYQIGDANDMNKIGTHPNDWDKHFLLVNDINLAQFTGTEFNIIGPNYIVPFTGVFDGNGHTISNFTYTSSAINYIGLFGYVEGPNAEIRGVGLVDPNIDAGTGDHVGSLVGSLKNGTITNCNSIDGSVSGDGYVGGLVGEISYSTVSNSYATCNVSGYSDVGGLEGQNHYSTVSNSYATGTVSGYSGVGGLVGRNGGGTVSSSYATGSVIGDVGSDWVGGLVGMHVGGVVSNSYATGSVSGYSDIGGLVGRNAEGTVSNSYSAGSVTGGYYVGGLIGRNSGWVINSPWDMETSGQAGSAGGTGKTTVEMMDPNTFFGWWCGGVWTIDAWVDYPRLWWEDTPGELITPTVIYAGGSGDPNDPYVIETAGQLNSIGMVVCDFDKHFKMTADIDLGGYVGTSFNIIGIKWIPFTGVFDGNGHTISNFTYGSYGIDYIGLFGYVEGPNAEIRDIALIDADVDAGTGDYVGSLVGSLKNGTITDCNSVGGSISGSSYIGGLVGENWFGTLSNSSANGNVSGTGVKLGGLVGANNYGTVSDSYAGGVASGYIYIGGLTGDNYNAAVSNSYATGNVSGTGSVVGGLVGRNREAVVSNSYATGNVSGDDYVGGLVGWKDYGTVNNSYATGSVSGGDYVGGLVGDNFQGGLSNSYAKGSVSGTGSEVGGLVGANRGHVVSCFWDVNTSGQGNSAGGTGKTTMEMMDPNTFFGWWCGGVWTIDAWVDYPRLWWEDTPGELITPTVIYAGGSGDPNDPYVIETAGQLNSIGMVVCDWDKHFRIVADIDLGGYTGTAFNIIGNSSTPFTGVFDGNGYTISNFSYSSPGTNYIGLFGYIADPNAEIKYLTLVDYHVEAQIGFAEGSDVGSLVGMLENGNIIACHSVGGSVSGNWHVGGLVGKNAEGIVSESSATGSVSGAGFDAGGLVGDNAGTVNKSYAGSNVSGTVSGAGGLVGNNRYGSIVSESYATGTVSGSSTGGLIGVNQGTICNSYTTVNVSGTGHIGGLVGYHETGDYIKSFWDNTVNPVLPGIGNATDPNVIGESTVNMQTESTFVDAGWNFVDVWSICEGTNYPRLIWQISAVDFFCPDGVNFTDYCFFAEHWRDINCGDANDCEGTDLDLSDRVDWADLEMFFDYWLKGTTP